MLRCITGVVSVPFIGEVMLSQHNTKQMQDNALLAYKSPIYSHLLELNGGVDKVMQQDHQNNVCFLLSRFHLLKILLSSNTHASIPFSP